MEIDSEIEQEGIQTWGTLIHLSAFLLFFTGIGYLLGPLVIWLFKRHESTFIEAQGKEVLNFQLTCTGYLVVITAISFIFNMFILLYLALIVWMIVVIQASQAANRGESYRYPLTLRLIK